MHTERFSLSALRRLTLILLMFVIFASFLEAETTSDLHATSSGASSYGGTVTSAVQNTQTVRVAQTAPNLPGEQSVPTEPEELEILRKAFSDITFTATYDKTLKDWQIKATFKVGSQKSELFYWCESRLLPENQLKNKSLYLSIFEDYPYGEEIQDPSTYTQEQIEEYRYAGLSSTRKNEPYSATFLLDFVYSSSSRKTVEEHISTITFLGHKVTVNDRLVKPLDAVEKRLLELKKTNKIVADFLDKDLDHLEGYNWREISDVDRKSFHSTAIAIDFLPPKLNRHMYWRWTKDQKGEKWMLVPLSSRWMLPYDLINVFEEEGFIWGGKWLVWDNMHFEYRPELLGYHRWKIQKVE